MKGADQGTPYSPQPLFQHGVGREPEKVRRYRRKCLGRAEDVFAPTMAMQGDGQVGLPQWGNFLRVWEGPIVVPFQTNAVPHSLQEALVHFPRCGDAGPLADYGLCGGLEWAPKLHLVVAIQLPDYRTESGVILGKPIEIR